MYLSLTSRTSRSMCQRHTMGSWKTGEVPSLHYTSKSFTDSTNVHVRMSLWFNDHDYDIKNIVNLRGCCHVNKLTRHEMGSVQYGTNWQQGIFSDSKFSHWLLWFDIKFGVMDGDRLSDVLLVSTSDLQGCISVFLLCSNIKNLNIFELHGGWQCWSVTITPWLETLRSFYSTWRMVVGILAPHSSQNVDIPFFLAMTPTRCDWGVHVDCWSEVEAACRTVELLWRHAASIGRVLLVATAEVMLGSNFVREFIAMRGPMLLFSGENKKFG